MDRDSLTQGCSVKGGGRRLDDLEVFALWAVGRAAVDEFLVVGQDFGSTLAPPRIRALYGVAVREHQGVGQLVGSDHRLVEVHVCVERATAVLRRQRREFGEFGIDLSEHLVGEDRVGVSLDPLERRVGNEIDHRPGGEARDVCHKDRR